MKIEIKNRFTGEVLFELDKEDNTIKDTVEAAVKAGADLTEADFTGANFTGANLFGANFTRANLFGANFTRADFTGADFTGADFTGANFTGADFTGANLYGIKFEQLPTVYINLCSRDMLFTFQSLKHELPFLREKLIKGEISGTQYEGDCACLIGTLAKADGGINKVCNSIRYYDKGLHNPSEQWFFNIHEGDTPENNDFAKHALKLIDSVLNQ